MELCSKSSLKSYLAEHEADFMKSLEYFDQHGVLEPLEENGNKEPRHDVTLLHFWAYQVNHIDIHRVIKTLVLIKSRNE